jgi:Holliday junction DNA helicase RuvB
MLDVDGSGLDVMDRKLLRPCCRSSRAAGGVDNLAAAIGEERDTIEDVLEPYLIQQGLPAAHVARPRRDRAFVPHFGLTPPTAGAPDMFSE